MLVQIENKKLYASEIEKIIHDDTSHDDSIAIANAFIDRWIKDKLLISDAEKFLSSDFEIEEKVEDYRNDLIKYKYQEQIINEKMSDEISDEELQACYNKYKRNYLLSEGIYKIIFAGIPGDTKKIDRFYNAWLNTELDFIKSYANENADTLFLNHDEWINEVQLKSIVPNNLIKGQKLKVDKTIQKNIGQNEYFFKILEMKEARDTIPLVLISDKIRRLLLHERKKETIENYKQTIFEKAMRSNRIKIDI